MALLEASLRRPRAAIVLALAAMSCALITIRNAKLDVLPDLSRPTVIIRTEAPGFVPEEVEALVTRPIEQGLAGADGLESVRSRSIQGLSVVIAELDEGVEIVEARRRVSERLARISKDLPAGVAPPILAPQGSSSSLVLGIGLTSRRRSLMDIGMLAHGTVVPRLLAVAGVAGVAELGGEVRQLQIRIRHELLARHGLSPAHVVEAARRAAGPAGAGSIETVNQNIPLWIEAPSVTPEEMRECLTAPGIRLGDVARVVDAPAPKTCQAAIDGEPGVLLLVRKQHGRSSLDVTEALDTVLDELRPLLEREGLDLHRDLFRPAGAAAASTSALALSVLAGGGFMALVLAVFLLDIRAAAASLVAIFLPLLGAAAILSAAGCGLNALTLGGIALALAAVAGDAVGDVQNVVRRLRENRSHGSPRSVQEVVLSASAEVRGAAVVPALAGALVFLPLMAERGVLGLLFAPLGIAFILTVLASLAVSVAVTPALSLVLAARAPGDGEPVHLRRLTLVHRSLLGALARRPAGVLAAAGLVTALAAASVPFLGHGLLSGFQEDHLIVRMSMVPGTSAVESMRLGSRVSKDLAGHPLVGSVSMRVGGTDLMGEEAGPELAELIVALRKAEDARGALDEVQRMLAPVPGAHFAVEPLLEARIEEAASMAMAEVVVRLFAEDLEVLDAAAGDVERVLLSIPGAADVRSRYDREPRLRIRLRKDRLEPFELWPRDVLDAVRTGFYGTLVGQVRSEDRATDVVVILDEEERRDPEGVGSLLIWRSSGTGVPLREVADVFLSTGRHAVLREGSRRYQEVSADVEGRDPRSFAREARARIANDTKLPPGVRSELGGAAQARARGRRRMLLHSALAGASILLLLALLLRRSPSLVCLLAGLPFAISGGVLALLAAGGVLSLGSLAGLAALFGIAVRSAVVVVSRSERLVRVEGMPWNLETAILGASESLVPLLATACVTAAGLLPLALCPGPFGAPIHGRIAIAMVGGLAASGFLSVIILPILLLRHGKLGGA